MNCPVRVTHAIESVPEVKYARVFFSDKTADVEAKTCTDSVINAIGGALHKEGYGGTVREIRAPSEPAAPPATPVANPAPGAAPQDASPQTAE